RRLRAPHAVRGGLGHRPDVGRRPDPGGADDDGAHREHGRRGAQRADRRDRRAPVGHPPPGRAGGALPQQDPGARRAVPPARRSPHEDKPARLPDPPRDRLRRADGRHVARAARPHAGGDAEGAPRPSAAHRPVVAAARTGATVTALEDEAAARLAIPVEVLERARPRCREGGTLAAARSAADTMEAIEEERLELADASEDALAEPLDLLEAGDEAPVIRLVNALFCQALKDGASDIHLEPYERTVTVRFRVDGILHDVLAPPIRLHPRLVSRLKVMARLDIAERRLPQDGRIRVHVSGRDVDVRVSILPTAFGERAVLRLLDRAAAPLELERLGLAPALAAAVDGI